MPDTNLVKNKAAAGRELDYRNEWDQLYNDSEYELRESYTFPSKAVFMRLHIWLITGNIALCLHRSRKCRSKKFSKILECYRKNIEHIEWI